MTYEWEGGFNGDLTVVNNSNQSFDGWLLQFTYAGQIDYIWNASVVSQDGDRYVITNEDWNAQVAADVTSRLDLRSPEADYCGHPLLWKGRITIQTLHSLAPAPPRCPSDRHGRPRGGAGYNERTTFLQSCEKEAWPTLFIAYRSIQ